MESRAAISIAEIQSKYGIKQSAAYKWRTALRNLKLDESWENYDRINNREINLSGAVKGSAIVVKNSSAVQSKTVETHVENHYEEATPIFGISPQRLAEINAVVEVEVAVEDALFEHHRQKRRGERAAKAAETAKEVSALDPKLIVEMAMRQIAKVQEIA
jgi:transposase-like protein